MLPSPDKFYFLFFLFFSSISVSKAQVQFRVPFSCEEVRRLENQEFSFFIANRYNNLFGVYSYLDEAVQYFEICKDSATFFHIQYAQLFKHFLVTKNTIVKANQLYVRSKNYPTVNFLALNEFIYQSFYNGNYSSIDSCTGEVPWQRFQPWQRSVLARRLYFLIAEYSHQPGRLHDLREHIDPADSVVMLYEGDIRLDRLGHRLANLYNEGSVIEGNVLLNKAFRTFRGTPFEKRLSEQLISVLTQIQTFGFKSNMEELSLMLYQNNDSKDAIDQSQPNSLSIFRAEFAVLFLGTVLLIGATLHRRILNLRHKKHIQKEVIERKAYLVSLLVRIRLLERKGQIRRP